MINWIRENAGLASVLAGFIGIISTGAVLYHQVSELIAKQPEVERHMNDTTRHIDPIRDAEEKKRLIERIEKLERERERSERRREWAGGQSWRGHQRERNR